LEQESQVKVIEFIHPGPNAWKLDNHVHVWKFPVRDDGFSLLTDPEKEFAGRFRFEGDRNRFIVGRQSLRLLLSKYLSVRPMDISIRSENGHKPFVSNPSCKIHFNISHSGDWVLIAVAIEELGIDVEKINPGFDFKELLQEHFNEPEQLYISKAADPVSAFYYLWTRKEALAKAWGTGLQENLIMANALDEYSTSDSNKKLWNLKSFHVSNFYPAAIAYSVRSENIIFFDGNLDNFVFHHPQSK
jgi:4'-phosphopantetheinyl transferase